MEAVMNSAVAAPSVSRPYILFLVAGTTYGLPSHLVRHVEMIEQVTPVPNAARFVDGVVFSRGQVVPVVNLRARFGFDRTALDLRSRLLVVDAGGRHVGLLVDEAREFVSIADDAIHPPGDSIAGLSGAYLQGIASMSGRLVLIVDVHSIPEQGSGSRG
jgi:purine-binding chemotaxis protein CheW